MVLLRLGIRTILISLLPKQLDKHFGISAVLVGGDVLTLLRDRLLLALNHSAWRGSPQNCPVHTARRNESFFSYEMDKLYIYMFLEKERDIDMLFHLYMHFLVDSYMCPELPLWSTSRWQRIHSQLPGACTQSRAYGEWVQTQGSHRSCLESTGWIYNAFVQSRPSA